MTYEKILYTIQNKIQNLKRERLEPGCIVVDHDTLYTLLEENNKESYGPVFRSFELQKAPFIDKLYGLPLSLIEIEYRSDKERKPYIEVYAKGHR